MTSIIKTIFAMLIIANASFAAMNVAILEITVPEDNEDIEISVEEIKFLTDELRSQAVSTLPQDKFTVLTREDIIGKYLKLSEAERERLASTSAVDIGKAIGVEYVAHGKINAFGDKLSLKVELYEIANGKLLGSFTGESDNATGFLGIIREKAPGMFDKIPCADGYERNESGKCILACPEDHKRNESGECVPKPCAVGYKRDENGKCAPIPCAFSYKLGENGECVPSFKIGATARVGFAKSGVKDGGSGVAYSAGFVFVKYLGFLDFVPELLISSEEFEINDKKVSILNAEIPVTVRVVLADVLGISFGAAMAFPLSSKIEEEAPKDIASFGIAATGGLSYLFTDNFYINAIYIKYFTEDFKSLKDSKTDKALCGIGYLF